MEWTRVKLNDKTRNHKLRPGARRSVVENVIGIIMVFRKDPCGFFCILMTYGKVAS